MKSYDLVIIGAGIIGAACADAAVAAGLSVAVVDSAGVGTGATAAAMGHLVALDEDPAELALARYSLGLWEEFASVPAAEFSRCGTLWIARDAREFAAIDAKLGRLRAAGRRAEAVNADELYRLEPELVPGLAGGLRVPEDAAVYAPNVAQFLLVRARARGAVFIAGRRAVGFAGRGRVTAGGAVGSHAVGARESAGVTLDDGTRLGGPVLIATGCALGELVPDLPLRGRKGHLVITDRYAGLVRHQLLELGYAESAHGTAAASVAFNLQPRPSGQLLIGSSREFGIETPAVSMPMIGRMLARAFEFVPTLRRLQALRIWTGFRPSTPDGRPYIGPVPDRRDVWVAAGHEGLGITTALGTARLLLDQMLGRPAAIDPGPYLPARARA